MARFDASDLDIRLKADASHVTEADLATERAIRTILEAERPADGVFGVVAPHRFDVLAQSHANVSDDDLRPRD